MEAYCICIVGSHSSVIHHALRGICNDNASLWSKELDPERVTVGDKLRRSFPRRIDVKNPDTTQQQSQSCQRDVEFKKGM